MPCPVATSRAPEISAAARIPSTSPSLRGQYPLT